MKIKNDNIKKWINLMKIKSRQHQEMSERREDKSGQHQ